VSGVGGEEEKKKKGGGGVENMSVMLEKGRERGGCLWKGLYMGGVQPI